MHPDWLLWGIGVGLRSSAIRYVTDQLAMVRLPLHTFALMLATATGIGLIVLGQVPTLHDLISIALIIAFVALHHDPQPPDHPGAVAELDRYEVKPRPSEGTTSGRLRRAR